jgi:hypothetical protein
MTSLRKLQEWLQESQNHYLKLDIDAKSYMESINLPVQASNESEIGESSAPGMIGMQGTKSAELSNTSQSTSTSVDMTEETASYASK